MPLIQLKDGTQAFILNSKDLVDVAYDKLGIEYSNEIEKVIHTQEENEIYAMERLNTDLDSYEGQIEEYRDSMLEVVEILEQLEINIEDSKKLNRNNILNDIRLSVKKLTIIL